MIYQINIEGVSVVAKYKTLAEINKAFDYQIHPNISRLMSRKGRDQVDGFLWARAESEQEALESVQDLALQNLFNTVRVSDKDWNRDTIDELITKIKGL